MFKIISRLLAVGLFLCLASVAIIAFQTQPTRFVFKDAEWNTIETAGRIATSPAQTAIVGQLESLRDIDYLTITVTKPQEIVLHLRSFAGDRTFHPQMVLFGRGLPTSSDIGIPIGDQNGAILGKDTTQTTEMFDPQTLTFFTDGPLIRTTLPAAGTYAVLIHSPAGWGRYTLTNGTVPDRSFDGWWSSITGSIRMILRLY